MNIIKVRSDQLFSEDGFKRFRSHINFERAGFSKDLRTKFYGEETPRKVILDSWGKIIENSNEVSSGLMEFEHDMLEKVGPYSIVRPLKDRINDLESYYSEEKYPLINSDAIKLTVSKLSKMRGLRMRNQNNVIEDLDLSKSAGNPYMGKKRFCVDKTLPCKIDEGKLYLKDGVYNYCAVIGHRSQEGGISVDNVKNRIIFMTAFGVILNEQQVYQPMIAGLQKHKVVPAYIDNDEVDYNITKLFDTKDSNQSIISTDFEKFDQHFNNSLQHAARECLFATFQKQPEFLQWINTIFPIKYNIMVAFNYEGDQVYLSKGPHGMSSGSGGTNCDETLAHMCLQNEAALSNATVLNPYSMCLGDDGILSYPGINIKQVVDSYSKHGLIMNTGKQHASTTDAIYLRRYYNTNYRIGGITRGVYSTYRAIGRLMAVERSIPWTKKLIALRQLSIIENVKWHPLREVFVQWCMKGDKFRLGLDIPNFFDNLDREVEEASRYIPDFIGYNKSVQYKDDPSYGINKWWIVNYLKSIAKRG